MSKRSLSEKQMLNRIDRMILHYKYICPRYSTRTKLKFNQEKSYWVKINVRRNRKWQGCKARHTSVVYTRCKYSHAVEQPLYNRNRQCPSIRARQEGQILLNILIYSLQSFSIPLWDVRPEISSLDNNSSEFAWNWTCQQLCPSPAFWKAPRFHTSLDTWGLH